jgi:D-alanyl-lipoteichoic acid acyltransferase DltB (MBOAT superfamily)
MLFNSFAFIFVFLPVTFFGFLIIGRRNPRLAAAWLAAASLFFYGCWYPPYLLILSVSILFNYGAGILLTQAGESRRWLLTVVAISVDLAALAYFKYANFFIETVVAVTGFDLSVAKIALPLGISFFTFTQIAFLVDCSRREVREVDFGRYVLFVTYFPHLIAGPIIHHKDIMPQFAQDGACRFNQTNFTIGTIIFLIGLFKKVCLADTVAPVATSLFDGADLGSAPTALDAWIGALSYTFEIYFDFSGYSDMAIGLSLLFNVKLPINFNSPYKSTSIIEFWKRWHISLSTFLRDYLYFTLGGNRRGRVRRFLNLMLTMLIGGLWHGASWTFVVWGGLHGFYLVVNHAWRGLGITAFPGARLVGWAVTFLAVVVAWVFFRAKTFAGALAVLSGMVGLNGWTPPILGESYLTNGVWCLALLMMAVILPNTQQWVARWLACPSYFTMRSLTTEEAVWRSPHPIWAVGLGLLAMLALMNLSQPSVFLYFNF